MYFKHGHAKRGKVTRVFRAWRDMLSRCNSPTSPYFADYGGRGITVCERWNAFENFLADMGEPSPRLTLDRIDNNKGYAPDNCRWATWAQQQSNRRSTIKLTCMGETLCIAEWARRIGLSRRTIRLRLKSGWSVEKTLTTEKIYGRVRSTQI